MNLDFIPVSIGEVVGNGGGVGIADGRAVVARATAASFSRSAAMLE